MNAAVKVPAIVAGMIGGADSIDDLGLLRHGAMPALFGRVRAPSTLGSLLRSFTWGNVLQAGKVNRLLLGELARRARHGRGHITLHLPDGWHREQEWQGCSKPPPAHPPTRPDQPTAVTAPPRPHPATSPYPRQATWTSRRQVSGRKRMPT